MKIYTLALVILLMVGCKTTEQITSTNSGNLPTGTLFGYITPIDATAKILVDKSGTLVSVDGTSFSTLTDTSGKWVISNLPTSTYNLTVSRLGFNTMKYTSLIFVGGGTIKYPGSQSIGQSAKYTVGADAFIMPKIKTDNAGNRSLQTAGTILSRLNNIPGKASIFIRFIIGKSPNLDINDQNTYLIVSNSDNKYFETNIDTTVTFDIADQSSYWSNQVLSRFAPGETVYIRLYPAVYKTFLYYYDINQDKNIYVGLGEGSNVLSAIAP